MDDETHPTPEFAAKGCASLAWSLFVLLGLVALCVSMCLPATDGPWELVQESQRLGGGLYLPAIYRAEIDGQTCLAMVGALADSLECE